MKKLKAWIEASRLRTLPLALASIGMGTFLAAFYGNFDLKIFLLCTVTTLFLQILSNLANDYGDSQHGADSVGREGPSRQVQSGLITKGEMLAGILLTTLFTLVSGIWLLMVAFDDMGVLFVVFFLLGMVSIGAAVKYTMGKKPYGYKGLGDLFVLIFFGIVGVVGSYYLQAKQLPFSIFLPALSFGMLSTGVLNLNNIRDMKSDKEAGKYSIPVRIGRKNAVAYHLMLLSGAFLLATVFTLINFKSPWQLIFLATLPLFIKNAKAVKKHEKASELDPYLKQLAVSSLLFTISFGVGLILTLTNIDSEIANLTIIKLYCNLGITSNLLL